jgi:hypothetical protein
MYNRESSTEKLNERLDKLRGKDDMTRNSSGSNQHNIIGDNSLANGNLGKSKKVDTAKKMKSINRFPFDYVETGPSDNNYSSKELIEKDENEIDDTIKLDYVNLDL